VERVSSSCWTFSIINTPPAGREYSPPLSYDFSPVVAMLWTR